MLEKDLNRDLYSILGDELEKESRKYIALREGRQLSEDEIDSLVAKAKDHFPFFVEGRLFPGTEWHYILGRAARSLYSKINTQKSRQGS